MCPRAHALDRGLRRTAGGHGHSREQQNSPKPAGQLAPRKIRTLQDPLFRAGQLRTERVKTGLLILDPRQWQVFPVFVDRAQVFQSNGPFRESLSDGPLNNNGERCCSFAVRKMDQHQLCLYG